MDGKITTVYSLVTKEISKSVNYRPYQWSKGRIIARGLRTVFFFMYFFSKDTKGAASVMGESHEEFLVFPDYLWVFKRAVMLEKSRKATALQVFVKPVVESAQGHRSGLAPGCLVLRVLSGALAWGSSLNQPHPSLVCAKGLHKTHS